MSQLLQKISHHISKTLPIGPICRKENVPFLTNSALAIPFLICSSSFKCAWLENALWSRSLKYSYPRGYCRPTFRSSADIAPLLAWPAFRMHLPYLCRCWWPADAVLGPSWCVHSVVCSGRNEVWKLLSSAEDIDTGKISDVAARTLWKAGAQLFHAITLLSYCAFV